MTLEMSVSGKSLLAHRAGEVFDFLVYLFDMLHQGVLLSEGFFTQRTCVGRLPLDLKAERHN